MENEYVEIEGSDNLIRDMSSHAVINTDSNALKQVLSSRAKRIQDSKDLEILKKDVNEMKNTMALILQQLEKWNKKW